MLIYFSLDLKLTTTSFFFLISLFMHICSIHVWATLGDVKRKSIHPLQRNLILSSLCLRALMKQRVQRESSHAQAFISFQNNGLIWFSSVSSSRSLSRLYSWSSWTLQAMLLMSMLLNTVKSEISSFNLSEPPVWHRNTIFFSTIPLPNHTLGLSSLVSLGILWVSVK